MTLPPEGAAVPPESFHYRFDRARLRRTRRREGRYLLRTNLTTTDPAELWQRYLQLVQLEEAFRNLKGDLGIRPIYHQLEELIEAHVFISFLAFALHATLKGRLRDLAPGLTLPRHTQPNDDERLLLERLHLPLPPQPSPRLSATQKVVL